MIKTIAFFVLFFVLRSVGQTCFLPPDAKARDWSGNGFETATFRKYFFPAQNCQIWTNPNLIASHRDWKICQSCNNSNAGYRLVLYTKDNTPQGSPTIDKPILAVQGFDPFFGGGQFIVGGNTIGPFTFTSFEMLMINNGFLRQLYDNGYDIFVLLFKDPHLSIQINSQVLIEAMQEVQGSSSLTYGNEIIVMGVSMGGLIARHALQAVGRDLLPNGETKIKAKLFVTLDTPNRGADIPMAIQNSVRYLNEWHPMLTTLQNNLLSPAASQMLLKQVQGTRTGDRTQDILDYESIGSVHGSFMREINSPTAISYLNNFKPYATFTTDTACQTDPIQCADAPGPTNPGCAVDPGKCTVNSGYLNTAGIANGHGGGVGLGYSANQEYLSMKHEYCVVRIPFVGCVANATLVRAQLITSNPNVRNKVFSGEIIIQQEYRYDLREPVLIETTPGGLLPLYTLFRSAGTVAWNRINNTSFDNNSFVPTISAAGLIAPSVNINSTSSWYTTCQNIRDNNLSFYKQLHCASGEQGHATLNTSNISFLLSLIP